jgi:uncharacterized OsmC-like protein
MTPTREERREEMNMNANPAKFPEVLNGINVADVSALIAGITADPAKGMTHWKVVNTWQGRTHNRAKVDGFSIGGEFVKREFTLDIDEPLQLGGSNQHANPQEYLLAAVSACMMVGFVAIATLKGIRLDKLAIEIEGDIDLRAFLLIDPGVTPGYEALHYTVKVKGDASEAEFAEIHRLVMASSPNFYNATHPIPAQMNLVVE